MKGLGFWRETTTEIPDFPASAIVQCLLLPTKPLPIRQPDRIYPKTRKPAQ